MKLFYSQSSPYVRLVRVFAHHHNLADEIELVPGNLGKDETELRKANPLGKIPALIDRNNRCLYDSRTILYYLDEIGSGTKLFDSHNANYIDHQRDLALLIGILEHGVALIMDKRRKLDDMPDFMQERWVYGIRLGLQELDAIVLKGLSDVLALFAPVILDWLNFRLPEAYDQPKFSSLGKLLNKIDNEVYRDSSPRL